MTLMAATQKRTVDEEEKVSLVWICTTAIEFELPQMSK